MRSLTVSELDQVSGGLARTSITGSRGTALASGQGSASPYLDRPPPIGGEGGGVYSGTLGDITNVGDYNGDDYITFSANDQNVEVTTQDRIVVEQQISGDEYQVELEAPGSSPDVDGGVHTDVINWFGVVSGIAHIVVGGALLAAGAALIIGTDGLALLSGEPEEAIGFGAYDLYDGIGTLHLSLEGGDPPITPPEEP